MADFFSGEKNYEMMLKKKIKKMLCKKVGMKKFFHLKKLI